ncbi:MAG TPA: peptide chain release factor N(5)-glutamine methyltransferase [Steroidobacteraceae bacterium]|nr:peptide chain release factor N(5)-glutamine methyltransferase [Steroidobacteraceae bacterium]
MSLRALLAEGRARLSAAVAAAAAAGAAPAWRAEGVPLEAQLLLAHVLRRPRAYLIAHAEEQAAAADAAAFDELLRRVAAGEPVAYVTGGCEFWSLPLRVGPAVLIPRPETELAVERCLALLPDAAASAAPAAPAAPAVPPAGSPCVCDLGTGSGAIACALASERPAWRITATDCSAPALQVARGNAARLGLGARDNRIEFLQGHWFEPLGTRRFDLLVSNPPYVGAADPALALLRHEPRLALTPGPSGLEALGELIRLAPRHLVTDGWLVLEHGADQAGAVARALVAAGYARVRCHRDLAGHARVTEASWPGSGFARPA